MWCVCLLAFIASCTFIESRKFFKSSEYLFAISVADLFRHLRKRHGTESCFVYQDSRNINLDFVANLNRSLGA